MHYSKTKVLCGSLAAVLASPTVVAQGGDGIKLEEIVVTATRVETTLQETPVAVTAISGAQIELANIRTLQDVAAYVPSMSIGNRAGEGAGGGAVSIRGMGVDAQDSAAAVATYIDDVYFASARGNILGLMDVDRVEVLRGPQGTLFGRNAIGGAVQYVTVAPSTEEFDGFVKASVGEWGNQEISAAFNIPMGDTLALRIAGLQRENDGWVRDESRGADLGDAESTALRLRLRWQPSDALTADLKYETTEQESEGVPSLVDGFENNALFLAIGNNNAALVMQPQLQNFFDNSDISTGNTDPSSFSTPGINGRDTWDFEYDSFSLNVTYDISDTLSIKSVSSYAEYSDELFRDIDGTPRPVMEVAFAPKDYEVFTQEIQLIGSAMDGRLNYTTGLYYFDGEEINGLQVNTIGVVALPGPPPPQAGPSVVNESTSVFAQVGYDLTDAFTITLGYRYTDEDVTSIEEVGFTEASTFNFTDSSPYLGLQYQFNDDMMAYAKAAKGFRAGGRRANFRLPGGVADFDPEEAFTYEAGLRMEFMDGRLRFNPTVYMTEWEEIQFLNVVTTAAGPVITTSNAGDADIFGVEIEGQFALSSNLILRASYSYMDAEYTRVEALTQNTFPNGVQFVSPLPGVIPPVVPVGGVLIPALTTDSELQRAPENKFTIGGMYTYNLDGGAEILFSADYLWSDKQKTLGLDTAVTMPSYGLLNGRIQYNAPDGKWSVAAYGNNLADEFYLVGGVDFAAGYTVGSRQYDVGRPRELGVSATFNF
ncbi:MAG: TonB-dependent receptor [Pseudomonadales bacterium]